MTRLRRRKLARAAAMAGLMAIAGRAGALTAVVNYTDPANTGFNDPAPASPVGGNSGTTLGAQRKKAFEYAVNVWAQRLQSNVTVTIEADFTSQFCSPGSAQLGNAGPALLIPPSGMPQPNTFYPLALANAIKGSPLLGVADINAHFNSGVDDKPAGGCLGSKVFYYGLDQNAGSDVSFVNVAVHEVGHGFGFLSLIDASTGAAQFGQFGIFDYSLFDENTSLALPAENNSQRAAAATSNGFLTWNDGFTNAGNGFLDAASKTNGHVRMFAPALVQPGSSLSHWDTVATPDLVMEPSYTSIDAGAHVDLTTCAFKDIGWTLAGGAGCPDVEGAAGADLSVVQSDSPDPAIAGSNVTYTITLMNNGASAASDVSLTDPLPAGLTFVSLTKPSGWSSTAPAAGAGGTVTFTRSSLAAGASAVFKVTAHLPSSMPDSSLSNTATASSSTSDPVMANNSATALTSTVASADLSITNADSPDPVSAGRSITYTIVAQNNGPSTATNVVVKSKLSTKTTFVTAITPTGWTLTAPPEGTSGMVTFTRPSFSRNVPATFKVVGKVLPTTGDGSAVGNTASISSATPDPDPANNSMMATTISNRSANVRLSITDAPDPVTAGDQLTYNVTFTNSGPSAAYGLTMTDPLPPGTTFVSVSVPAGWSCLTPAVGVNGTVTCTANVMNPTAKRTFGIVVTVDGATPGGTVLTNTASLASATADPISSNNTATAKTSVLGP